METMMMNRIAHVFLLFSMIFSCNIITDGDRDDYIGKYKFSIKNSDVSYYHDDYEILELLNLEISENDSFYFSHDVPFFANKSGKVEYRSIDGIAWCYLIYQRNGVELHNQVGIDENGNLYINNTRAKTGAKNISKAYFTRIR